MSVPGRPAGAALLLIGLLTVGCRGPKPSFVPALPATTGAAPQLRRDIDTLLAASALQQGTWSVLVKSLAHDDTLYSVNAGKLLLPSSTMKVLTLAAAAERLGWDYTYETRLVGGGRIDGGVLDGPLAVVGTGDPSIDNWDGAAARLFQGWAEQLKAAGIRTITGDIIGDDNSFDDEPLGAGWMWDDLDRSFATGVGALQFNENTAQLSVAPGSEVGEGAIVTPAPASAGLTVRNHVRTTARGTPPSIATERLPGDAALDVRGSVPIGGTPIVRNVSVLNPTLYFAKELGQALIANGIEVRGGTMDIDDIPGAPAFVVGTTLVEYRSPPLGTLATTMMKLSQNLYAETLLKTLGASEGTPTAAGGIAAVRAVLAGWGVSPLGYVQVDGSGLSRYDYATADTFVTVLSHIDRDQRLGDAFRATLPIAGRDGTLEDRMKGTPAEGNARAKTGSMSNARALAGYVSTADGEPLVFAIMSNNFGVTPDVVDRAFDAIVVRLAQFSRK